MSCPTPQELLAMVDGRMERVREEAMRQHLRQCPRCRGTVDDWDSLVEDVAASSARYKSPQRRQDLLAAFREGQLEADTPIATGTKRSNRFARGRGSGVWSRVTAALGVATLLGVGVFVLAPIARQAHHTPEPAPDESGMQSRAGSGTSWAGIQLYKLAGETTERVGERILPSERLLIAYTNLAPSEFRWLSVVAVDALSRHHWLLPPHGGQLASVPIERDVAGREIPQSLALDVPEGSLQILAIFSTEALTVDAVESWRSSKADAHPEWTVQTATLLVEATQ